MSVLKRESRALLAVLLGMLIAHYQLPPYGQLRALKSHFLGSSTNAQDRVYPAVSESEGQLLQAALTDPSQWIGEASLPDVQSYQDIASQVNSEMEHVPFAEYLGCYDRLQLKEGATNSGRFRLDFQLASNNGTAHAYHLPSASHLSTSAILLIPGTGKNQGTDILLGRGYHGTIASTLREKHDVFILVKPNEDFRAIHDEYGYKLSEHFINVHLLRKGYSYSSSYLVEALALVKDLKSRYDTVGVAGLSQGGQAALFTALQSSPDFALIASGFSPLQWELSMADSSQVHVPGLYQDWSLQRIKEHMRHQSTRYLFTHGLKEGTLYEHDAKLGISRDFVEGVGRLDCLYHAHPLGHSFDLPLTKTFCEAAL